MPLNYQVHVCTGDRCFDKAPAVEKLERLISRIGIKGITVVSSSCRGACSMKSVVFIEDFVYNGALRAEEVIIAKSNDCSDAQWEKIFYSLNKGKPLDSFLPKSILVELD